MITLASANCDYIGECWLWLHRRGWLWLHRRVLNVITMTSAGYGYIDVAGYGYIGDGKLWLHRRGLIMVTYRKANAGDAFELARIRTLFLAGLNNISCEDEMRRTETANKAYFDATLADESFVAWLAVDDGKIVATSGLSFYAVPPSFKVPDGRVAYIMNMYTFPDYRSQGLGMELLKRTVKEAEGRGYKKVTLYATNKGKPIYERFGFKDVVGDMELYVE